jgi:hypothetical protein
LGILWTCLREAPELAVRKRRVQAESLRLGGRGVDRGEQA